MAMSEERKARMAAVLEVLNKARSMELFAIHQYMNQHYNMADKDYGDFAAKLKLIAIDEMRHAEQFAERIKELDGEPTSDKAADIVRGQNVQQIYPYNTETEDNTIDAYNGFLKTCRDNGDNVSARLFEQIIDEEQAHANYFDDIDTHITDLGDSYLSKIAGTPADTVASKGFVTGPAAAAN